MNKNKIFSIIVNGMTSQPMTMHNKYKILFFMSGTILVKDLQKCYGRLC